jgi:putative Mg2+ transporter-C (MgtC) family protein
MYATATAVMELIGQGWSQVTDLCVAFALSSIVGAERQWRGKSAGLRTQAIVGTASALIVLVSKYGFTDVIVSGRVMLDPSRVAAQIVSGIGFLGAGLIITRRGAIRGLTTAAAVWETAAIGMAAGAGLLVMAGVVTILHFVIVGPYTALVRRMPATRVGTVQRRVLYSDHRGALRLLLQVCTERSWRVLGVVVDEHPRVGGIDELLDRDDHDGVVAVSLTLDGTDLSQSTAALADVPGVLRVEDDIDEESE